MVRISDIVHDNRRNLYEKTFEWRIYNQDKSDYCTMYGYCVCKNEDGEIVWKKITEYEIGITPDWLTDEMIRNAIKEFETIQ